ncbi:hypothetical protein DdX_18854 [Ditylenchus destructor]|uniref:DUF229 domain containing protein n=1 Tax=Ditylenchus destructor TaxID=166010 RepID=A0AAD4QSL3_9BILA|nr:hypothetical protein DdX_18854 [Ditylenchus destructor]
MACLSQLKRKLLIRTIQELCQRRLISPEKSSKGIVAADVLNDKRKTVLKKIDRKTAPKFRQFSNFRKKKILGAWITTSVTPLENECRFPILHNDEPDLEIHVKHYRAVRCPQSNFVPLVTQLRNGEILFGKPHRSKLVKTLVRCFVREIGGALRPKHRKVEEIGEMIELPPNRRVNVQWQQFVVKCYSESQDLLFHDVFTNVPVAKPAPNSLPNIQKPYSISIFIIDSASRNQFFRHMPLTLDFMRQNGFEILHGYTKVGDNSAINLLPILAGMIYEAEERGFHSLYPENMVLHSAILRNSSDDFWQHVRSVIQIAKENGYVTMWNDDIATSGFGLFHYKAFKGFTQPPTDFYYRPYYEYIYQNLEAHTGCVNGQFVAPRYIDIWERFVTKHINATYFAFNFLTGLTHSSANNIELYDDSLSESLARLKNSGAFENSVVLIMGDHGQRISSIQKTHSGRVEERMPMMGIYLPERFKTDHPTEYENLSLNKNRLTSNFDIYDTLMDTLTFSGIQDCSRSRRMQPPAGISLFDRIPVSRSCEEARIPPQFCCCLQASIPNVDMVSNIESLSVRRGTNALDSMYNFQSSIQKTHSGRVEERMPMMGIYLPERFKTDHPTEYQNLSLNKNRLTSNFDIYETLMDTLTLSGIQDSSRSRRMQPPAGISLFDRIPVSRSCEEARIPPQFCCCLQASIPNVDMESNIEKKATEILLLYFLTSSKTMNCVQSISNPIIDRSSIQYYSLSKMARLGMRSPKQWNTLKENKGQDYIDSFEDDILDVEMNFALSVTLNPGLQNSSISLDFKSRFSVYSNILTRDNEPLLRLKVKPLLENFLCSNIYIFERICDCFVNKNNV